MKFSQYQYNPYMMLPPCYFIQPGEDDNLYRDIQPEEEPNEERILELDEISEIVSEEMDEQEEEEYVFESINRNQQDVNRVMQLMNTKYEFLYAELQRRGINRSLSRYIFRTILSFIDENYYKYSGTQEQKITSVVNDLRRQLPWVFYTMRSYGVPVQRVNQILRTIAAFALMNLRTSMPPTENIEQMATRITNLAKQETSIFNDLKNAGIPEGRITSVVRNVVLFSLRNVNLKQAPANIQTEAAELVQKIERTNPALVRQLQGYGMTIVQVRQVLRRIILFTLQKVFSREEE